MPSIRIASAGKTTLLRLIAGLEEPSDGSIFFDGETRPVAHPFCAPEWATQANHDIKSRVDLLWLITSILMARLCDEQ